MSLAKSLSDALQRKPVCHCLEKVVDDRGRDPSGGWLTRISGGRPAVLYSAGVGRRPPRRGSPLHLPTFDYRRPQSLAQALGWLAEFGPRAAVLAGGTDLLIALRQRLLRPELLVGIGALAELQGVQPCADGALRLGAGTPLTTLVEDPLLRVRLPALAAALQSVGSRHVRNVATLGGNLNLPTRCWYVNQGEAWRQARPPCLKTGGDVCHVIRSARECFALQSSDGAVALLALGARLELARAAAAREVALDDFYRNDGLAPTTLDAGELVTAVYVPVTPLRSTFLKIAPRTGLDYGLGTVAAAVAGSNRRVTAARIVLGSIGSWPVRLRGAERIVAEGGLEPATIEAAAEAARADLGELTNLYSTAGDKRRLARVLVRRALAALRRQPEAQAA